MPTLFRLVLVGAVLYGVGYAALYGIATLGRPAPREMVQVVALPQAADVRTGRSAAETLDKQASALVRHHRGHHR